MSLTEFTKVMLSHRTRCEGPESVLATRVWLSRNIDEPFACGLASEQRRELSERLLGQIAECDGLQGGQVFELGSMQPHERRFLAEAALIPGVAEEGCPATAMLFTEDPRLSVLLAGEDHIRIQCLREGLQLHRAFACADSLDMSLEDCCEFAFSEEFGYLTASPQLAGTGMRATVLQHLPALGLSDELPRVFRGLRALGFTALQSVQGDGRGESSLLEIANLRSLGGAEMSYLEDLRQVAGKLDEFEARARERLLREARSLLEDHVWSAYGLLRHGRVMTEAKAMRSLGELRLGCMTGLIQSVTLQSVQDMWLRVQDGYLQAAAGGPLDEEARDHYRAERLREWLSRAEEESIGKDKLA